MTTSSSFDFEKLVPGFEFLKNIGKSQTGAGLSSAASWVAPTLDPKELDRKIQELKTVQFWLEQNAKGIGATIQALEVQKMTLSTLRGMNFSMQDLSESLKANANAWTHQASESTESSKPQKTTKRQYSFTNPKPDQEEASFKEDQQANKPIASDTQASAAIDPAVWWNSLGEQFQHIAEKTVKEMQKHAQNNQHLHAKEATKSASAKRKTSQPKKTVKPAKRVSVKTVAQQTKRKTDN